MARELWRVDRHYGSILIHHIERSHVVTIPVADAKKFLRAIFRAVKGRRQERD